MTSPILAANGLSKRFASRADLARRIVAAATRQPARRELRAVSDVTLGIAPGEILGLVGESGCGKSTLGRMLAGLHAPSEGQVRFKDAAQPGGEPILAVQMVFQDALSSLNPTMRVADALSEAPRVHGIVSRQETAALVEELMREVGLDPRYRDRFPHQFSGGQRQRIGIARALAVRPEVLLCDEPVAALDVSVQAQILNLFLDLRDNRRLALLFISHDLAVVEHIADRIAVMYLGRIVETAPAPELFARPAHPYTRTLLAARPALAPRGSIDPGAGDAPSPLSIPQGCAFHTRCAHADARCRSERPELARIAPDHESACHLHTAPARPSELPGGPAEGG